MIRQDKVKYINKQCEAIEQYSITNTTKDLYRKVKYLTRELRPTVDTIKDEEGKILQDGPDIKNRWKLFCEDLYKRNDNISSKVPNTSYENVELDPSPRYSEIEKAIKEIKSNKSAGIDDIPLPCLDSMLPH